MLVRWPLILLLLAGVVTGCATHSRVASAPVAAPRRTSAPQDPAATAPTSAPVPPDVSTDATFNRFAKKQAELKAEPASILRGRFTTLSWKLENATDVRINRVPVAEQGSMQIWPKKSSRNLLTARVQGNLVEDTAEAFVAGIGGSPNGGNGGHSEPFRAATPSKRGDGLPEAVTAAISGEHSGHPAATSAGGASTS